MTKIKVAHCADSHLRDTQFQMRMRGQDFTKALLDVVEKSAREKVDVIIHAGDMLDTLRPTARTIKDLQSVQDALEKAKLAMLVVRGNHDFTEPPWHSLLNTTGSSYGFICIDKLEYNVTKGGEAIKILGLPFMQKADFIANVLGKRADILVWHGMVSEFVGYPVQEVVSIDDIPDNAFTLVALGDIHERNAIEKSDGTVVCYPGSTELCNRREQFDKSFFVHEFECENGKNTLINTSTIPVATRKVIALHVDTNEAVQDVIDQSLEVLDSNPMILVTYHPDFPDTPSRLKAAIDTTKCILRVALKRTSSKLRPTKETSTLEENRLTMLDFLPRFITPGTKLFGVGQQMINPDSDAKMVLDNYIEEATNRVVV